MNVVCVDHIFPSPACLESQNPTRTPESSRPPPQRQEQQRKQPAPPAAATAPPTPAVPAGPSGDQDVLLPSPAAIASVNANPPAVPSSSAAAAAAAAAPAAAAAYTQQAFGASPNLPLAAPPAGAQGRGGAGAASLGAGQDGQLQSAPPVAKQQEFFDGASVAQVCVCVGVWVRVRRRACVDAYHTTLCLEFSVLVLRFLLERSRHQDRKGVQGVTWSCRLQITYPRHIRIYVEKHGKFSPCFCFPLSRHLRHFAAVSRCQASSSLCRSVTSPRDAIVAVTVRHELDLFVVFSGPVFHVSRPHLPSSLLLCCVSGGRRRQRQHQGQTRWTISQKQCRARHCDEVFSAPPRPSRVSGVGAARRFTNTPSTHPKPRVPWAISLPPFADRTWG